MLENSPKSRIRLSGVTTSARHGLPVSLYRYLGDPTPRIGLMADEVERVHPEAVMTGPVGFKMVNYDRAVR